MANAFTNDWTKKYYELDKRLTVLSDEYYELRDNKSDGCCVGLPVWQVLEYDEKILTKVDQIKAVQAQLSDMLKEVI